MLTLAAVCSDSSVLAEVVNATECSSCSDALSVWRMSLDCTGLLLLSAA